MSETETVEVRAKLHARLEEIAEIEDMSIDDLVDHALRSYAESYIDEENEQEEEAGEEI
jgi:predicted transcriptional regulator